jgi:ketosteroid isomerase-like protein
MSEHDVELARRGYAALNEAYRRRDVDHLRTIADEMWHPDIVLTIRTQNFPEIGEWHGHEGMLRFTEAQTEAFDEMWLEVEEIIDAGDRIVVPLRFGGRGRHAELPVEFAAVHVWTMEDGRATRVDMYDDRQKALVDAGLARAGEEDAAP